MKKLEAVSYFGNTVKLAEALGIAQSAVSQWGEEVPPLRAFEIERITNGKLRVNFTKPQVHMSPSSRLAIRQPKGDIPACFLSDSDRKSLELEACKNTLIASLSKDEL